MFSYFGNICTAEVVFNICAFVAIICSIMIYFFKSPLYSVFSLIISIVCSIIILLILKVEFLGYVLLLVYVGAITLLFIFVIMLLNLKREIFRKNPMVISFVEDKLVFLLLWLKLLVFFFFFFRGDISTFNANSKFSLTGYQVLMDANDIYIFKILYTQLWYYLILVGFILLLAMLGALILTMSSTRLLWAGYHINFYWGLHGFLLNKVLFFAFALFFISFLGILFNRKHILILLLFSELFLFAASFNYIVIATFFFLPLGQVVALLFIGVAASESVIGLGLLIIFFKRFTNINLDSLTYFSK